MVNNELERMFKEVVAAHLKVISRHLPAGTVRTIDVSASPNSYGFRQLVR
jgi:hypothetical protein